MLIWSSLPVGSGGTIATDKPLRVPVTASGLSTPPIRPGNYLVKIKLSATRDALGPYPFTMPDGDGNVDLWTLIAAGVNIPPDTPVQKIQEALAAYLLANPIETGGLTEQEADDRYVPLAASVKDLDALFAGDMVRNVDGVITSFSARWPDGSPGTYTTLAIDPSGAVNSYQITYGSPVTKTFTQPTITRDSSGSATTIPAVVVS